MTDGMTEAGALDQAMRSRVADAALHIDRIFRARMHLNEAIQSLTAMTNIIPLTAAETTALRTLQRLRERLGTETTLIALAATQEDQEHD